MLKMIIGPAGAGKSRMLCQKMVEASVKYPSSSFIAIVPEQSTLMMQRNVVAAHPQHAVMNIDIVSFERLAYKVLEAQGYQKSQLLNDTGKVLVLRSVLDRCREDLVLYKNKIRMNGFAAEMKTVITELKQYAVDDNTLFLMQETALRHENRVLAAKLQDIRLVYKAFREALAERYQTQEDLLGALAREAADSGLIRNSHIYMDGFTGFTPVQYQVIRALLNSAADLTLTLTIPAELAEHPEDVTDHFQLSSRTLLKLKEIAASADTQTVLVPANETVPFPAARLFRGSDMESEICFIAGQILKGIRSGRRYRDYAVICSDMDAYYPLIRNVFSDAGISCFVDYKTELGNNALARLLVAAMQLVSERFSFDSVFGVLKSGMTELSVNEISRLENYCLEFGIHGVRSWASEFTHNRKIRQGEEQTDFWDLREMNGLREKVTDLLFGFYRKCTGSGKTAGEYTDAVKFLLNRMHAEEKMAELSGMFSESGDTVRAKEYEQIYERMTDLLDQIAGIAGEDIMSAREYADMVAGSLEDLKISIIPPSLDAVIVGDLTRTRIDRTKVLFLAGANEGKLPQSSAEAGLFTRNERDFLKQARFDLAPTVLENLYTQYFYIYLLLAKPKEELYVTCAASDMAGTELYPSCIVEELEELYPGICLLQAEPETGEAWLSAAEVQLAAAIRRFTEQEGEWANPEQEAQAVKLLRYFYLYQPDVLHQVLAGAFYTNRALDLDEQTALDLYGDRLRGSVSRYEKFYECPFKHFLNYGLGIEKRPEYEVQAADVGTVYHDSLERYSRKLEERGLTFREISDDDSHALAQEAVEEAAADMEHDALMSTERGAYLMKRMIRVTQKTTDVLRMHVREGLYEPAYFEMTFRDTSEDSAVFKGRIDRVDLYDAGDLFVKIIDYKSGNKKFSIRDIYTGKQLQLLAYLKGAIREVRKDHPEKEVLPGGVYYYLIQDRFVRNEQEAVNKFKMSGLTNCREETLQAIDTSVSAGGASSIAEISYTKTGLSSRSSVANDEEFASLMDFTNTKITDAARRIKSGEVGIRPLYISSSDHACLYCEFKDICKFEPGKWGSDYLQPAQGKTTEEMEGEIYGRNKMD